MKKMALLLFAALTVVVAGNAQKQKWKEMEDFHTIMSETFHPAEEGKLEPIKSRSQEMVDKAQAWMRATAPAGYDKKSINAPLKELLKGAKQLDALVKASATDKAITDKLTELHNLFHTIVEKCEKPETH